MQESGNSSLSVATWSDGRPTGPEVPESARNAAGALEQHRRASLASLDRAIQNQEDKVEERRKELTAIVRTKGIIYRGTDTFSGQSVKDEGHEPKNAVQTFHQLEQEQMQLERQVK